MLPNVAIDWLSFDQRVFRNSVEWQIFGQNKFINVFQIEHIKFFIYLKIYTLKTSGVVVKKTQGIHQRVYVIAMEDIRSYLEGIRCIPPVTLHYIPALNAFPIITSHSVKRIWICFVWLCKRTITAT